MFGLFWLLGYQFSPRLADIGESRFWRIERVADYGPLNGMRTVQSGSRTSSLIRAIAESAAPPRAFTPRLRR